MSAYTEMTAPSKFDSDATVTLTLSPLEAKAVVDALERYGWMSSKGSIIRKIVDQYEEQAPKPAEKLLTPGTIVKWASGEGDTFVVSPAGDRWVSATSGDAFGLASWDRDWTVESADLPFTVVYRPEV